MTEQLPQAPPYHEPDRHIARVRIYDNHPIGFNPADLTELGSELATTGLTTLQVRAMMGKIQQIAAQAAVAMAPEILEEVRKIQEARIIEILQRIRLLPMYMGHVQRDRVLQIVQDVATRVPRS
jgi:hypothetical protein